MTVARNILLFTLLIDYADNSKDTSIWNIYYHLSLDKESLELLHIQTQKLHPLSTSIQTWHSSKYGKLLRICDQGTLLRVRRIWGSWDSSALSGNDETSYNKRFESEMQKSRAMQAHNFDSHTNLTGFRSAAPISVPSVEDLPGLFQHFWEYGITSEDRGTISKSKIPNPMFIGLLEDALILHYGADPLIGFHLATAYASLTPGFPLQSSGNPHLHKVVAAARLQFRKWSASFRKSAEKKLTIRFFAGDALAFCHTLQHMHTTGSRTQPNWYRDPNHLEALILDGEDYASKNAPLLFNVIDTSNLLDHLGAINLLVATSPLLEKITSATLYTEILVTHQKDLKALADSILCGHFPTLSIIFGLMPIEYWTTCRATSNGEDHLLAKFRSMGSNDSKASSSQQMYIRLTWKRIVTESTAASTIRFDGSELGHILFQVYLKMFQNEDFMQMLANVNLQTFLNYSALHYHRGSFASFLLFVKNRAIVNWNEAMLVLTSLVEGNSTLMLGKNYIQELYLQLHLLDLYSVSEFRSLLNSSPHSQGLKGLGAWKEIPGVICITLKVPRAKLRAITRVPLRKFGTQIINCVLQSSDRYPERQWQNSFAGVQVAFGEISASGSRSDDDFRLKVLEDVRSWSGDSSLILSFLAPSWMVLQEPHTATVAFSFQATPQSSRIFGHLGPELIIYKTKLGNEDNVYMTKYRPNHSGHALVCNFEDSNKVVNENTNKKVVITIKAGVDIKTGQITTLTGRLDILLESIKSSLRDGATVETVQTSPCTMSVAIGKSGLKFDLLFPVPVLSSRSKSRIARKSSYIEVIAPMANPRDGDGFPHFMCPMFPSKPGPVIWNLPRLNLDCLPVLNTSKKKELEWLTIHTSFMFSSRERHLRESCMKSSTAKQKDPRINFKESLFSMFMKISGVQGRKARVFGINNPDDGGVHILVFVSYLRLDLQNRTVVLDAAILPLQNPIIRKLRPFLENLSRTGLETIIVDSDELRLWKEIIPAWVERCRQWEHRPSCDYLSKSKIPLSVEFGQNPICSCGEGTLPPSHSFDLPGWNLAARYAVRAAISPLFSVPFVEEGFNEKEDSELAADSETECNFCAKGKPGGEKSLSKCGHCQAVRYCSVGVPKK